MRTVIELSSDGDEEYHSESDDLTRSAREIWISRKSRRMNRLRKNVRHPPYSNPSMRFHMADENGMTTLLNDWLRDVPRGFAVILPPPPTAAEIQEIVAFMSDLDNFKHRLVPDVHEVRGFFFSDGIRPMTLMRLLDPLGWLDSSAINTLAIMLEHKSEGTAHSVIAVSADFWTGDSMKPKAFKAPVMPACRYVVAPVCVNGNHWTLFVADTQDGRVRFYDYMHGNWSDYATPQLTERLDRFVSAFLPVHCPNVRWGRTIINVHKERNSVMPRQADWYSCGIYVVRTIELLTTGNLLSGFALESWDPLRVPFRVHYLTALLAGHFPAAAALPAHAALAVPAAAIVADDDDDEDDNNMSVEDASNERDSQDFSGPVFDDSEDDDDDDLLMYSSVDFDDNADDSDYDDFD